VVAHSVIKKGRLKKKKSELPHLRREGKIMIPIFRAGKRGGVGRKKPLEGKTGEGRSGLDHKYEGSWKEIQELRAEKDIR